MTKMSITLISCRNMRRKREKRADCHLKLVTCVCGLILIKPKITNPVFLPLFYPFPLQVDRGANSQVWLASGADGDGSYDKSGGLFFQNLQPLPVNSAANNDQLRERLWLESERLTGVSFKLWFHIPSPKGAFVSKTADHWCSISTSNCPSLWAFFLCNVCGFFARSPPKVFAVSHFVPNFLDFFFGQVSPPKKSQKLCFLANSGRKSHWSENRSLWLCRRWGGGRGSFPPPTWTVHTTPFFWLTCCNYATSGGLNAKIEIKSNKQIIIVLCFPWFLANYLFLALGDSDAICEWSLNVGKKLHIW